MKKSNLIRNTVEFSAFITISFIVFILGYILVMGTPNIIIELANLINGKPSIFNLTYNSNNQSMMPAILNTLIITGISIVISSFFGIITAIYLVEYAKTKNKFVSLIQITSETLSGIPSIIYGLFGAIFFVTFVGLGLSVISGILTVSIMILPLIIRSTEEALKAVPITYREASFALGASKIRTVFTVVLPSATKGILAGVILAIGRIIGETAALLYTAGTSPNTGVNLFNTGRTLSVHMYILSGEGLYIDQTYATAAILLFIVLAINILATYVVKRLGKGKNQ